jgi:hypothetical protein
MVPFKGRWDAPADLKEGFVPCPDPDGNPTEIAFPSIIRAEGQVTHLGRTQTVIYNEGCTFHPATGTVTATGSAVHTGAHGDAVFAEFQNETSLADGTFGSENIQFVGGTGRFEGATGRASSQGTLDLTTFEAAFTIDGMISSVGSLR